MMKRKAFTLVELLVVIGIIALLIGILLPSLARAREAANAIKCESNLRQFGFAFQMYADANKGVLPYKGPDGSNTTDNMFGPAAVPPISGVDDASLWFNALPPYVNYEPYIDMLVNDYQNGGNSLYGRLKSSIFMCPSCWSVGSISNKDVVSGEFFLLNGTDSQNRLGGATKFKFHMSYVMNSKLTDPPALLTQPLKLTQCRPSSECVLMSEKMANSGEYRDADVQAYNAKYPAVYAGRITVNGLNNNVAQPKANWKRFTTIHRGGGYILFTDGHVAWYKWQDVQAQPGAAKYTLNTTLNQYVPTGASPAIPDATTDCNQYGSVVWNPWGPIN